MIRFLIEKEFKQIMRNPFLPRVMIVLPIMMMVVFPWAANQEVKNLRLAVVDYDHSTYSERLTHKATASGYFKLSNISSSNEEALEAIEADKADIILEIQPDFEKQLITEGTADVMISANAVNSMKGGLGSMYLSSIMRDYASDLREESKQVQGAGTLPIINIVSQNRFNPLLDYKVFMVPALMVILLTMLCGFLPALNIVSEKEKGTIEQINVTPVGKFTFILAKLIPYWTIGFLALSFCFVLAAILYGIIPLGNLVTIYLFASIYILLISGLGLVISNYSDTMQQAMFVMFFFILILILMSGLFTPVSSMPEWAQTLTIFNPLKYFMQVMRMVYLKGSSIVELVPQALALCSFALVLNIWAVISYRKSS